MFDPSSLQAGAKSLKDNVQQLKKLTKESELWQKHGKSIKGILNEWIGPLAIASAKSLVFLVALKNILGQSQLIQRSLEAWGKVQYYTPSFAKLLGSVSAAKARLAEIARMSANGPFKFDSLVQANRRMEILTRGMFSGKAAMEKVSDAAAAAGIAPEQAAESIGQAMKAIADHEGVDGAIKSLADLGIISNTASDQIRNLAAAGVSEQGVLGALQDALGRNKGAAQQLGDTLYGLTRRIEAAKDANMQAIGGLFSEGSAAGMRAGLTMLQAYGPVLTDLLKPVAAIYNAWNKMLETLAKVASLGPVKQAIQTLAVLLGVLATAFAMKGIQVMVVGLAQAAKFLLGIVVPATRAATGLGIVRVAAAGLFRICLAALGPIGLLATALAALAEVWGAFGGDSGGGIGGAIKDLVKDVKDGNDQVSKLVSAAESGGDLGAKGEALGAATEQLDKARQKRKEADSKKAGGGTRGFLGDVAAGAAIGAMAGSVIPVIGTAVGGTIGAIGGAVYNSSKFSEDEKAKKDAAEQERVAEQNVERAAKANALTPADYMNDPDYQKAKKEGQAKLNSLQGQAQENRATRDRFVGQGGDENSDYVQRLDEEFKKLGSEMKVVGAGVSPEALKKAFNIRMAEEGSRVTGLRATANGDQDQLLQADRLEAQMRTDARAKELKAMGIGGEKADKMARVEGLSSLADSLQSRGQVFASSRASVGMAVGEAAGGVPPEFQKVIDEIRKIQNELNNGNAGDTQARIQGVMNQ